jgi:single-stranded DNA-binding protein
MLEVHIAGRLTADAQLKRSAAGNEYVQVGIACPNGSNRDGSERSDYVKLMAFGEAAQKLTGAKKGSSISAIGRLEAGVWQPDGKPPRPDLTVSCWQVMRLGAPKPRDKPDSGDTGPHSGGQGYWGGNPKRKPADAPSRPPTGYESLDDDLPF